MRDNFKKSAFKHSLEKKYRILSQIGQGGTADVFKVQERVEGKLYAAKIYKSQDIFAFHECNILSAIHHPVCPEVKEIMEYRGRLCLVMELVHGTSMKEALAWQIPPDTQRKWAVQLLLCLDYLHHLPMPIYYCDLKPENIMLLPNGNLKLVDFGAARFEEDSLPRCGTKEYAPPELYDNNEKIGTYTDLFSLGKLLQLLWNCRGKMQIRDVKNLLKIRRYKKMIRRCTNPKIKARKISFRQLIDALSDMHFA